MTKMHRHYRRNLVLFTAAAAALVGGWQRPARASSVDQWIGGDFFNSSYPWSSTLDWVGASTPGAGTSVDFDGKYDGSTNNCDISATFDSVSFTATNLLSGTGNSGSAQSWTINGNVTVSTGVFNNTFSSQKLTGTLAFGSSSVEISNFDSTISGVPQAQYGALTVNNVNMNSGTVNVNPSTSGVFINGTIAGYGTLQTLGGTGGTTYLSGNNPTFGGTVVIPANAELSASAGSLGVATVQLSASGYFYAQTSGTTNNPISVLGSGPHYFGANGGVTASYTGSMTYAAGADVVQVGSGTVVINTALGMDDYQATNGQLILGVAGKSSTCASLTAGTAGGSIGVLANATVNAGNLECTAGSTIFMQSGALLNLGGDNSDSFSTGVFSGAGSLGKVGTGLLNVEGQATYTGSTTVSGGILQISSGASLGTSGGTITVDASGSGSFITTAGVIQSNVLYVGLNHAGTFNQSGGANTASVAVEVGYNTGSYGNYDLVSGSLASPTLVVGFQGLGYFYQNGGTVSATSALYLGYGTGSVGNYTQNAGSISTPQEIVGYSNIGTFAQNAGTNNPANFLYIGYGSGSVGTYYLYGGTVTTNQEIVGYTNSGTFVQSGGVNNPVSYLYVGYGSVSSGEYELSGGSLSTSQEIIGFSGNGSFIQTGGTNVASTILLGNGFGQGYYSLTGGLLQTNGISAYGGLEGTLVLGGGATLQATASNSAFIAVAQAEISTGGITIDSQAYNVTVVSALVSNPVLGITTDGGLNKIGSGTLNLSGGSSYTGATNVSAGTMLLSGAGPFTMPGTVNIGGSTAATMSLIGSATLSTGNIFINGTNTAPATFSQTAGTFNSPLSTVLTGSQTGLGGNVLISGGSFTSSSVTLGYNGSGTMMVSGTAAVTVGSLQVGIGGAGILNISAGTLTATNALALANNSGSTGVVRLTGGTLATSAIGSGAGNSTLFLNGGTLQATNNSAGFIIVTNTYVEAGGAIINPNGCSITIAQPLLHDSNTQPTSLDGGLTLNNTGTLVLSGSNNFTGVTNLSAGTLSLANANALHSTSSLLFAGGTLQYTAANTVDYSSRMSVLPISYYNYKIDTNGTNVTFATGLAGVGGLVKLGAGSLALTGINTYTGQTQVASGNLNMAGGSLASSSIVVGPSGYYSAATFSQNAGTVNTGYVAIGNSAGDSYVMSGTGILNVGTIYLGDLHSGVLFNQSGGTVNVSATLEVGYSENQNGNYYLGGGTLNVAQGTIIAFDSYTQGVFNQTGGTHITPGIYFNAYSSSTLNDNGTYILAGGVLETSVIAQGSDPFGDTGGGTSSFNFSGGTLQATANNLTFMTGLTKAIVTVGGGMINTSNYAITIAQPLLHDATAGAPAIDGGLTKLGTGALTLTAAETYTGTTNVSAGTLHLGSAGSLVGPLAVQSGATAIFDAATSGRIHQTSTGAISISSGGSVMLSPSAASVYRTLLITPSITVSGSGNLNIGNGDLDLTATTLATVNSYIHTGYNGGAWSGAGIDSSSAGASTGHLTAVGVIQNNQSGTAIYSATNTFDGMTPGAGDILVKYTYYGDTNLDGTDYSRIDNGFANHLTGWLNGDFNYDGVTNGSDYTLIDNAFNRQGAAIQLAVKASQIFGSSGSAASAVPEPGPGGLATLATISVLGRRRSRWQGRGFLHGR